MYVHLILEAMESAMNKAEAMQFSLKVVHKIYNIVCLNVSKGKLTIAVLRSSGDIIHKPSDVFHTSGELIFVF